uniref:C-type lectin domain-containing protein n=1 Tax=Anolis carolinensis TaxID=28377 RepID=A0A803SNN5_ANOCA
MDLNFDLFLWPLVFSLTLIIRLDPRTLIMFLLRPMSHVHLSLTGLLATAFFLQDKAVSSCPNGWMSYQRHCYGLFTTKLSWMEAEKDCQSHGSTGHLASINSEMQNNMIKMYIDYNFNGDGLWIGLFDPDQKGAWQWSDHSAVSYLSWNGGKPIYNDQKACVHLSSKSGKAELIEIA